MKYQIYEQKVKCDLLSKKETLGYLVFDRSGKSLPAPYGCDDMKDRDECVMCILKHFGKALEHFDYVPSDLQ